MNPNVDHAHEDSEQAEFDAIRDLMTVALKDATSESDATERIKSSLPKNRSFLGPMVIFSKDYRSAQVQTFNDEGNPVDIETEYHPS